MARPKSLTPTPGEIEILQVLWQHGVCTVRQVHDQLLKQRRVAHTTVASMMQLMEEEKGQLKVADRVRPFRYEAVLGPDSAKDICLNDLANRLFGGSAKKLVLHLASTRKASRQQLQKIEKALADLA